MIGEVGESLMLIVASGRSGFAERHSTCDDEGDGDDLASELDPSTWSRATRCRSRDRRAALHCRDRTVGQALKELVVDEGEPGVDLDARGHGRCCATLTRCRDANTGIATCRPHLPRSASPAVTRTPPSCGRATGAALRRAYRAASGPGRMFLFTRKRFSGSQRAFTAARRSKFGPKAARTRSSPSSALRKLR